MLRGLRWYIAANVAWLALPLLWVAGLILHLCDRLDDEGTESTYREIESLLRIRIT